MGRNGKEEKVSLLLPNVTHVLVFLSPYSPREIAKKKENIKVILFGENILIRLPFMVGKNHLFSWPVAYAYNTLVKVLKAFGVWVLRSFQEVGEQLCLSNFK